MGITIGGFIALAFAYFCGDFLSQWASLFSDNLEAIFKLEKLNVADLFHAPLSETVASSIYSTIYGAAVMLLVLRFLWKGTKVYVLWRDGDSENDPKEMLVGAAMGLAVTVGFPLLYDLVIAFVIDLAETIAGLFHTPDYTALWEAFANWFKDSWKGLFQVLLVDGWDSFWTALADSISAYFADLVAAGGELEGLGSLGGYIATGIFTGIMEDLEGYASDLVFGTLYAICGVILAFRMMMIGIELLVWRMGLPLAACGLIDSDGGVFKPYMQCLIRQAAALIVMYVLSVLAALFYDLGTFGCYMMAMGCELTAITGPKLMQQFVTPGAPSGVGQKTMTLARAVVGAFRML